MQRAPFEIEHVDPPVDFEPISRTKITAAPVRPETLHRERLLDWLDRHTRRRLTFVVANAGYGKTTLLADFSERALRRCIWFRLDHTDGDWVTFLNYMTAAIQTVAPEFGRATYSLFSQVAVAKPSLEAAIDAFMVDIGTLPDEPFLLVLDDYHLVDEAPDVHAIISRLLRDGPTGLHFLIASRREPEMPVARLQAHGEVASIDSTDLRFTRDELETLFADGFGQPLEPDILDMLERRTEGWAACIQLLQSTLRDMRAVEIRRFVEHLSVTDGPVYAYLAQEVLREARPDLRAFLVRSSILEPVVPELVIAAMSDLARPPSDADVRALIRRAYEVGLLSKRDAASGAFRFHPLLREFLQGQLARESSASDLAAIHVRVAQVAEPEDWLVACRHYLAGADQASAVRLLDRSVLTAVGTGAWGQAAEIVAALRGATAAPDVEVILAMEEIEEGRLSDAIARLEAIDRNSLSPQARALVRHGLLRAHWMNGDLVRGDAIVDEILGDASAPQMFRNLAGAHRLIATPDGNQDLVEMIETFERLARQHEEAELPFFAAISYYNLMAALSQHAEYSRAVLAGQRALDLFDQTGRRSEIPAAAAMLAICTAELSRRGESAEYATLVEPSAASQDPDAVAQLAYLALATGNVEAPLLLQRLSDVQGTRRASPAARTESLIVREFSRVALPDRTLGVKPHDKGSDYTVGIGSYVYGLAIRTLSDHAAGDKAATFASLMRATEAATASQNHHWLARLEVVYAALTEDTVRLQLALARASGVGDLALLDIAEVIVDSLDFLQPLPQSLRTSITRWPTRWLPVIRRKVAGGYSATSHAAAKILEEYGESSDIPLLRAYDRTYLRRTRLVGLGRKLIADQSPVVAIHDLGRGSLVVRDRSTTFGSMRRRAAGLLCYLASRPARSATREQIMEDLWSDLAPASAANSLNQTLYFLRRDLDPHFDEDTSYEYISHSGELVWLDSAKVVIDSVRFDSSATAALSVVDAEPEPAIAALELYQGRFAIEFEYEEWSMGWRDYLHSTFLHLARSAHRTLASRGDLGMALTVAHRALSEDPQASEIEKALVWTYAAVNSHDAATRQYQHFAATFRELHDEAAPSFEEVTRQMLPAREL